MHGSSAPAPKGTLVRSSPSLLGRDPHFARKVDVPGHFLTSLPASSPDIESPYFNCRHPLASAASSGSDIENLPLWNRYLQKYPKSGRPESHPRYSHRQQGKQKPKCPLCTDLSILFSPNLTAQEKKELFVTHGCTYHRGLQDLADGKPVSDQVHEQIWRMSGGKRYGQLPEGERPFLHINQTRVQGREFYKWYMGSKSSAQKQTAGRGDDVEKGREINFNKGRECDVEKGGYGDDKYRSHRRAGFTGKRLLSKKVKIDDGLDRSRYHDAGCFRSWILVRVILKGEWEKKGRDENGGLMFGRAAMGEMEEGKSKA
ncbi:MAG: hypothetical protein Q9192_008586 [Flavoplaca navasiana]